MIPRKQLKDINLDAIVSVIIAESSSLSLRHHSHLLRGVARVYHAKVTASFKDALLLQGKLGTLLGQTDSKLLKNRKRAAANLQRKGRKNTSQRLIFDVLKLEQGGSDLLSRGVDAVLKNIEENYEVIDERVDINIPEKVDYVQQADDSFGTNMFGFGDEDMQGMGSEREDHSDGNEREERLESHEPKKGKQEYKQKTPMREAEAQAEQYGAFLENEIDYFDQDASSSSDAPSVKAPKISKRKARGKPRRIRGLLRDPEGRMQIPQSQMRRQMEDTSDIFQRLIVPPTRLRSHAEILDNILHFPSCSTTAMSLLAPGLQELYTLSMPKTASIVGSERIESPEVARRDGIQAIVGDEFEPEKNEVTNKPLEIDHHEDESDDAMGFDDENFDDENFENENDEAKSLKPQPERTANAVCEEVYNTLIAAGMNETNAVNFADVTIDRGSSKTHAAAVFHSLLELLSTFKVVMVQREPYSDIFVTTCS